MKKVILTAMTGLMMAGQAFSACPYTLDATQAQISSIWSNGIKFPTISGQTVSFNATASTASYEYEALNSTFAQSMISAAPSGDAVTGNKVLPSSTTGTYAVEFKFDGLNSLVTGSQMMSMMSSITGTKNNERVFYGWTVVDKNQNTITAMLIDTKGVKYYSKVVTINGTTNTEKVGWYINQNTKQVGVVINGVNQGYLAAITETPAEVGVVMMAGYQGLTSTSPYVGQTLSGTLITDGSQMTQTYLTGTKDICGNTL